MAITTAQAPEHQLKTVTEWSLSVLLANFIGFSTPKIQNHRKNIRVNVGPASHTDNVSELLDKIDQGYIVEETGERARIPRFARAWLQSSISSGDWV